MVFLNSVRCSSKSVEPKEKVVGTFYFQPVGGAGDNLDARMAPGVGEGAVVGPGPSPAGSEGVSRAQ